MKSNEPLTESYFYILLCLFHGPNHGYGIMQESLILSNQRVKIGSGTMYGAVSNMIKKKWIIETKDMEEDSRKRLYRLTDNGKEVLLNEIERLKHLVDSAIQVIGEGI